jgi:phosphatidylserine decarboxylase
MTKVYNRITKKVEETTHFGGNTLNKIYQVPLLTKLITSKPISKLYGLYNNTNISKKKINKFINKNNIDMSIYKKEEYHSFNDFFIRKLNRIKIEKQGFISPCNGKLLVYKINKELEIKVKNITYKINELIDDDLNYKNGYVFIYRLALDDYHRFHYIDDGKRIKRKKIKGKLHTVSSSSSNYKVYKENEREYSILETKNYNKIIYIEVGALLVGKIINYDKDTFKRGEEKGYFLPGGSTIIIIANNIKVDKDILEYSKKNIETIVHVGEKVGE